VIEGREGYRFGPENLTLAWALKGYEARRVVDLGAGSGSLGLIAAWSVGAERLVSVERQAEQVSRLSRTFEALSFTSDLGAPRCEVICADLREPTLRAQVLERFKAQDEAQEGADLVVLNPPFFPEGWGRASESLEVHASTHSLHGDVGDFLACARALLAPQGRIVVLYDAGRLADLLPALAFTQLSLLSVHYTPETRLDRPPTPFRVWVSLGVESQVGGAKVCALERPAL
jgi:tRNA1(Val) A37 N6-methylase TrmN6